MVLCEQQTIDQIALRGTDEYKDPPSAMMIRQQRMVLSLNSHASPTEVMKQIDRLDMDKSRNGNILNGR